MLDLTIDSLRTRITTASIRWQGELDGDYQLNPDLMDLVVANAKKEAAVLIGFVEREEGLCVILTKRTEKLASHSGQVAFPGGKIDPTDRSAAAAALREAQEEIGLDTSEVEIVGQLPDYRSGSGFLINPVMGIVSADADFEINADEVEYMFEVPLAFLMNPANHLTSSRVFQGRERFYYEMPYDGHYIWGVTAGMIRVLHDRVFKHEAT
ncbi:MAG: CoA pyrophosphatase [Pseudomonadota bacterium]